MNFERVFQTEQEAQQAAQITIQEILGNPRYLDRNKFQDLLQQYKQSNKELDDKISDTIKQQIDAINLTKNLMEQSFVNLQKAQQQIEDMNQEYIQSQQDHQKLQQYEKLATYRKNIGIMLDQMKYLFSVKEQIDKMNQQFQQGEEFYEQLNYKLIALTDIRDNLVEAVGQGTESKQDLQVILGEFGCLQEFETKFYDKLFSYFEDTLILSIEKPQLLIKILQIIETSDKIKVQKQKDTIFKYRAIKKIKEGIDKKFYNKLKDHKDAIMILENCKFTSQDLIQLLDHTIKCFPQHYDIFKVFEDSYRENIEKRILPFLEDEDQVTKSFGTLINLLSWLDSYNDLLSRVGQKAFSFIELIAKVKQYMPKFLEHVSSLIEDYSGKAISKDRLEQQTQNNIEKLIKNKQDLVTYFPEDIFHFVNQQFDILGKKLKGEIMIEFIREVCSTLSQIMKDEQKTFENDVPTVEEQGGLSPIFLLTLHINNYYKCLSYSNETMQYSLKFIEQKYHERIEQIFQIDLKNVFNECINKFLEKFVRIITTEVSNQIIPSLFSASWQNQDYMNQAISTIKDYLNDIQIIMLNQIHFNKLVKLAYKYLLQSYIEQLIYATQQLYGVPKGFFPKQLTNLAIFGTGENSKQIKEKKSGFQMVLTNRELLVPQMEQDKNVMLKFANQDHLQQLGKTSLANLDKYLTTLINSISKDKKEIDLAVLFQTYEQYASQVLEVIIQLRPDCDAQFKKQKLEQLQHLMK
ncbi:hypothetical protein pb186bvf_001058 [Paramecium bursaria]